MEPTAPANRPSGVKAAGSVAVVGALLLLAGCTSDTPNKSETGAATEQSAAEHVGTYRAVGEGGDGALLEGTVRIVDDCFVVEQSALARYLPFFPEDEVGWSDSGLDYGGETYGDGDTIALGGGASGTRGPVPANCMAIPGLRQWTVDQAG